LQGGLHHSVARLWATLLFWLCSFSLDHERLFNGRFLTRDLFEKLPSTANFSCQELKTTAANPDHTTGSQFKPNAFSLIRPP